METEDLHLQLVGKLICIQHSCIELGCNAGNVNVKSYNAAGDIKVDVFSQKRVKLCGYVLQTGEVTLQNKLKGDVLGLLYCGNGAVNRVGHAELHRDQLTVGHGSKIIKRGDHGSDRLYKICRVDSQDLVGVFLSNHIAVQLQLIHVLHYLIKYGSENRHDVLLYTNQINQLKKLVVVDLCKNSIHRDNIQNLIYTDLLGDLCKIHHGIQLICRDGSQNSLQIQSRDQSRVIDVLLCRTVSTQPLDHSLNTDLIKSFFGVYICNQF